MQTISASIGPRRKNNPKDVALLQLAAKVLKNSEGKSYYNKVIDGKYNEELENSLHNLCEDNNINYIDSIGSFKIHSLISKKIFALLPQNYKKYDFHFIPDSHINLMMAVEAVGGAIGHGSALDYKDYNVNNLSLPNREAKSLLFIMKMISLAFKFFLTIEKIGVSGDGRFFVRLGISGGKAINVETGRFDSNPKIVERDILDFLEKFYYPDRGASLGSWEMVFKRKLVMKTKTAFEVLKNTKYAQRRILREAGFRPSRSGRSEEVFARCYATYEDARMLGELDKDTEEFFFQCFGDSRDTVLQKQESRKFICIQWLKELKSEASREASAVQLVKENGVRLNILRQQKAEATGMQASMVGIEALTIALGQLKTLGKLIDSALEAYSKGPKKWHDRTSRVAQEAIVGSAGMAAEKAIGTLDVADVFLFVMGLAGTAFIATPIGFAVVIVANAASILKTLYEAWTYEDKIDEEIKEAVKKYRDSVYKLEIVLRNMDVITKAMAAENCFTSKADYEPAV